MQTRAVLADINSKIIARYPKASAIINSREFIEYVNKTGNPYSSESEFDILPERIVLGMRSTVLKKLDGFVESRGKPKPPVGVEPQQGGARSGVGSEHKGRKMSDDEYRAKRRAILGAPKGTYPPNALANLVNEYMNGKR